MCDDRPWTLTAPWWGWPKLSVANRDPRATAPLLQKFDSSDPVTPFVKDPQRSLAFTAEDVVQETREYPAPAPGKKKPRWGYYLHPTGVRKLFLPSHKRFYLVACELHCDSPGLPSVARDKVCEAGFVVRRRQLRFDAAYRDQAASLVNRIGALTAQLSQLEHGGGPTRLLRKRVQVTRGGVIGAMAGAVADAVTGAQGKVAGAVEEKALSVRDGLRDELAEARRELLKWRHDAGVVQVGEGWIADPDQENVGAWQPVADTPGALEEVVYPLSPLNASPGAANQDAAGKTIWFGLLPAGSREVDATGTARFDETSQYEIRCFVRRHRCDCPRKPGERNDCGGELVWSHATPAYQLAAHFDPVGTGNHPVTIQMPDLPALQATVGAKLPVQMKFPANSALPVKAEDGKPVKAGDPPPFPQICFFSIPLITIIATFVLTLFLPIVVLLFQLWFLLGLKFCIPPSLSISAGAAAEAQLSGKIDLELKAVASLDVDAAAAILDASATLANDAAADLNFALLGFNVAPVDAQGHTYPHAGSPGADMAAQFPASALAPVSNVMTHDRGTDPAPPPPATAWVSRVERWEVGA
ncbi:MAG: hypothetical protein ACJ8GN_15490 [Longimicrobiaceae bacterium]